MLYEVITADIARLPPCVDVIGIVLMNGAPGNEDTFDPEFRIASWHREENVLPFQPRRLRESRITSYNVCYTKLLRKPRSGSTININDVGPRSATGYVDIPATAYEVDAKVENVSASATTFFTADMDQTYTVVVLDGDPPTVRVRNNFV